MELALVLLGVLGPPVALIAVAFGAEIWDTLTPLVTVLVIAGAVALFI